MKQKRLFLHPGDNHGIVVSYFDDNTIMIDWFGSSYKYPTASYLDTNDSHILNWARKQCDWNNTEYRELNGVALLNPFTYETEGYTLRGTNPRQYKKIKIESDNPLTSVSLEDIEIKISGTILEVSHSTHPSWVVYNLGEAEREELLRDNGLDSSSLLFLTREDPTVPLLIGHEAVIERMSEEIPHSHKILDIDSFMKGQDK